jgi:hypothetical protein
MARKAEIPPVILAYLPLLRMLDINYRYTKNPLCVWDAYQAARSIKKPIPEWVLKYLDSVSDGLLQSVERNFSSYCGRQLGFERKGGSMPYTQYMDSRIRLEAFSKVVLALHKMIDLSGLPEGTDLDKAFWFAEDYIREKYNTHKNYKDIEFNTISEWYYDILKSLDIKKISEDFLVFFPIFKPEIERLLKSKTE